MLSKIQAIIDAKKLLTIDDSVLIACSCGVDSMVLLHIIHALGYKVGVAHVNYGMRGNDSKEDEILVRQRCAALDIPCYISQFPEKLRNYKNFQQEARNFRYAFFEQIRMEHTYNKIATAHHMDDEIETFFIHLFRASGINGLSGIDSNLSNTIIRPLLELSKSEIYTYAYNNEIAFREDKSNFENKYLRNKIRNLLIPSLINIDALSLSHISQSIQHLKESAALLSWLSTTADFIHYIDECITIDIGKLDAHPHGAGLLYYISKDHGFNRQQTDSIFYSDNISAHATSHTHVLVKERRQYLVKPLKKNEEFLIEISNAGKYEVNCQQIELSIIQANEIAFEKGTEYLSFDQWPFPLTLRSRKTGDVFKPLGMQGRNKMLKKFIIDEKLNSHQKTALIIFEYDHEICYVSPVRISESFKLKSSNAFILKIVVKSNYNKLQIDQ